MEDNSDLPVKTLAAARNAYKEGKYSEALNLYSGLIHKVLDADIYIEIGSCYYKLNSPKEALEYWEKATKLDPKKDKAYANIGKLYYRGGEIDRAISYWLIAIILRPEDAQTCLNLAVAFDKKEMRFEAIHYFEKYIKYEVNKANYEYIKIKTNISSCFDVANNYLTLGAQLQSQNENEKAANCYFKALANYPNLSKINMNLGSIFYSDKNYELAAKYWLNACHIDPSYDKVYSNLAITYDLLEEFDYAYAYYNMYMNFIVSNKDEYYKVNRRVVKLKAYLQNHNELVEKHLIKAKQHVLNAEIYQAIDEYKIYTILKPETKSEYMDIIAKLQSYINPEANIIKECFDEGERLLSAGNYKDAKPLFARVMKLSSQRFLEFSKAKAKYSKCEKLEMQQYD